MTDIELIIRDTSNGRELEVEDCDLEELHAVVDHCRDLRDTAEKLIRDTDPT